MLMLAVLFAACGPYSFSGTTLPHIKTIAIPLFQDETAEFGVKEELTNALIQAFTSDNTLKIGDRRNADSVLEGKIVSITDRAGAYNRDERVSDIQVYLLVEIKYQDQVKRKVIWEDRISQYGTYSPSASEKNTRIDAIAEAITKITDEVVNRTVSGW